MVDFGNQGIWWSSRDFDTNLIKWAQEFMGYKEIETWKSLKNFSSDVKRDIGSIEGWEWSWK